MSRRTPESPDRRVSCGLDGHDQEQEALLLESQDDVSEMGDGGGPIEMVKM